MTNRALMGHFNLSFMLMASPASFFHSASFVPPSAASILQFQRPGVSPSRFESLALHAYPSSHHVRHTEEEEHREDEALPGDNTANNRKKKTKDLRPSFYQKTLSKWSMKISSNRSKLPWEEQDKEGRKERANAFHFAPPAETASGFSKSHRSLAPMEVGERVRSTQVFQAGNSLNPAEKLPGKAVRPTRSTRAVVENVSETEASSNSPGVSVPVAPWVQGHNSRGSNLHQNDKYLGALPSLIDRINGEELSSGGSASCSSILADGKSETQEVPASPSGNAVTDATKSSYSGKAASFSPSHRFKTETGSPGGYVSLLIEKLEESMSHPVLEDGTSSYGDSPEENLYINSLYGDEDSRGSISFPWEKRNAASNVEPLHKNSNTSLAESTIPEPELRRLRNVALRMKERMKIGPAGVTKAVVDIVHQRWNEVEVVKFLVEGPPSFNMKRTHEILERKTGGIVIWRSGSSLVLFRGLNYNLPCARALSNLSSTVSGLNSSTCSNQAAVINESGKITEQSHDVELFCANSSQGSIDASNNDNLLNQLGPRYVDWSGCDPLPIDADLLPGVVPGYKPPFRLLPYKVKRSLTNKQMTFLRKTARSMAPHFALGRSRQLQGLANAMVKLWGISAIAKIAIKRGVPNTNNERMAEELKGLTGGTLLSRNKEYIVFYRGNDFLTQSIRQTLAEREKLAANQQDEEENARLKASPLILSKLSSGRVPVAGTLAETLKACNHWANEASSEDLEKMRRQLVLSRHVALIRHHEQRLSFAISKVRKAEKALAKLQKSLQPAELPTDLETVTEEERISFRKIGLKMTSYLPLGRREVFDGTIQNIHLNWKHLELAKILVRGKTFAQVKHIAISLEAESGGILISVDKTTKGYVIIIYRGKNYQRPAALRPKNLLSKREALARAIELQRREALKHHIAGLHKRIKLLKSQLVQMEAGKGKVDGVMQCETVEEEDEEACLRSFNTSGEEEEEETDDDDDDDDDFIESGSI